LFAFLTRTNTPNDPFFLQLKKQVKKKKNMPLSRIFDFFDEIKRKKKSLFGWNGGWAFVCDICRNCSKMSTSNFFLPRQQNEEEENRHTNIIRGTWGGGSPLGGHGNREEKEIKISNDYLSRRWPCYVCYIKERGGGGNKKMK
jgi:hypothetical protein